MTGYMKELYRWLESRFLAHKIFAIIDEIMIYDWIEFHKSGNANYLIKNRRFVFPVDLVDKIQSLVQDFYSRFGQSKEYFEHLKKMQKAVDLMAKQAKQFDTVRDIRLTVLHKEIEDYQNKGEQYDFYKTNA